MAADTRTTVLDAAGRLFDERGFAAVSIADLTAATGVSNGSIYHHFGAKDGVLAALVTTALSTYQDGLLATFEDHQQAPEAGIRAAVTFELRWYEANPRAGRLILAHRDAVAASDAGRAPLRAANRAFLAGVRTWLDRHDQSKDIDISVLHAIVFAPGRELGSLWLARRIRQRPTTFAPALGDVAWAGIEAINKKAAP